MFAAPQRCYDHPPKVPEETADRLGLKLMHATLIHLHEHTGVDRYWQWLPPHRGACSGHAFR
ncbi:MAG: hypothetical protein N3F11_04335 [Casimicrobiaceae bacterium]|nr:hypothetical protein [Casimicrobiaceae bacterium]